MKAKAIADAVTLLELLRDDAAFKKKLDALQKAKTEADKSIAEAKELADDLEVRGAAVKALAEDNQRHAQALDQREALLQDAERSTKFTLDQERKALVKLRADQNKAAADKAEELNRRENQIAEQAKKITEERLRLEHWAGDLGEREETLKARLSKLEYDQRAHADKVAKLRELTQ